MNTASVVTELQRLNSDWTRAQILDVINNIVKLCLKTELDSNVYVSTTTGNLPYLVTTAGTFNYTPSIAGVSFWAIKEIVTDLGGAITVASNEDFDREYRTIRFLNRSYVCVPTKKTAEVGSTTPTVTFLNDPGTTTATYRIMAYQTPTDITSETAVIPIDDNYRYSVVVPACQQMIDALDNGRYAEGVAYIERELVPKLQFGVEKDYDRIYSQNYGW